MPPTPTETARRERVLARAHLGQQLDRMCLSLGLDPWEAWRRPRQLETVERVRAQNLATRNAAVRILGQVPRDRHGRFAPVSPR